MNDKLLENVEGGSMPPIGVTRAFLRHLGVPEGDLHALPDSGRRFPDGAQFRIEIPSVEGSRCLEAVLEASTRFDVAVHRVSQGSGSFLHTSAELDEIAHLAAAAGIEVSMFARPSAAWGLSSAVIAPLGAVMAGVAHGQEQVVYGLADAMRAAAHGIRSVLISDLGVLDAFSEMRHVGLLPTAMQAKVSVMLPVANPMTARVVERLGADTINIATDLTLPQIAAIRAVVSLPLDIYVESPDNLGGFMRQYEIAELVRIASPVYLKFGLRNAPDVYPSGTHLDALTVRLTVERVRRARIGMELLAEQMPDAVASGDRPLGLAIPVVDSGDWEGLGADRTAIVGTRAD